MKEEVSKEFLLKIKMTQKGKKATDMKNEWYFEFNWNKGFMK